MGVILCSKTDPAYALRIEELGIRVYSVEELCWCMRQYPVLFLQGFVGEPFFTFLAYGAGEQDLAAEFRISKENGASDEDILMRFLSVSGCLTEEELASFRNTAARERSLTEAERTVERADLLFRLKKFGKAVKLYEEVLNGSGGAAPMPKRKGLLLEREGDAYANLFLSERAFRCYEEAEAVLKEPRILKKIYFLACMEPVIGEKQRFLEALGDDVDPAWDAEFEEAVQRAGSGPHREKVAEVFSGDPVQRSRKAAQTIRRWKEEYRAMI